MLTTLPPPVPTETEPTTSVRLGQPAAGDIDTKYHSFAQQQIKRTDNWARALDLPLQDVRDLLQEGLVCLWKKRASVRHWEPWFFRTMLLFKLSHLRAKCRRKEHERAIPLGVPGPWTPEAEVHQSECMRDLRRFIEPLSPERRRVVELYLLEEQSMESVAALTGVSVDTAKTRFRLAREDMQAAFVRERAKEKFQRYKPLLAAIIATFVVLWVRFELRFRSIFHASSPLPDRGRSADARRRRRRVAGLAYPPHPRLIAAACGLGTLFLTAVSHTALRPVEVSDIHGATAGADKTYPSVGLFMPAWAELEPGPGVRATTKPISTALTTHPDEGQRQTPWKTRRAKARFLLQRAQAYLSRGAVYEATGTLRRYEEEHPDNPYADHYVGIRVDLAVASRQRGERL